MELVIILKPTLTTNRGQITPYGRPSTMAFVRFL